MPLSRSVLTSQPEIPRERTSSHYGLRSSRGRAPGTRGRQLGAERRRITFSGGGRLIAGYRAGYDGSVPPWAVV